MMPRQVSFGTKPRSKYNAVRTVVDGITFDSKGEAGRYSELKLLQAAGIIRNLELQPEYLIEVNGQRIGKARADFRYERLIDGEWLAVVEDFKGCETLLGRWKRKLVAALHGVEIEIVRGA